MSCGKGSPQWPTVPELRNSLGLILGQLQRLDEAIAEYEQALRMRPVFIEAENNLGVALRRQGRLDEAERVFRRAIAHKADFAEGHNGLGNVLREQGRIDEARRSFETALSIAPRYPRALSNLGATLADLGRPDDAVAALGRALELDPRLLEAHNNLGNVNRELGRIADAMASYRRALAIEPAIPRGAPEPALRGPFRPRVDAPDAARRARGVESSLRRPVSLRETRVSTMTPTPTAASASVMSRRICAATRLGRFMLPLFARGDRSAFELLRLRRPSRRRSTDRHSSNALPGLAHDRGPVGRRGRRARP